MQIKTLFMSDEERHTHHLVCLLPLFFKLPSNYLPLGPVDLNAECVQVSVIPGASRPQGAGSEAPTPKPEKLQMF